MKWNNTYRPYLISYILISHDIVTSHIYTRKKAYADAILPVYNLYYEGKINDIDFAAEIGALFAKHNEEYQLTGNESDEVEEEIEKVFEAKQE